MNRVPLTLLRYPGSQLYDAFAINREGTMTTDDTRGLPTDLLSLTAACRLLPGREPGKHLHVATLWRWTTEGRLPAWRIGGCVYVSRADVLGLARPIVRTPRPAVVRTEQHARAVERLAERGLEVG